MDLVCYPKSFLNRPEDRLLLDELAQIGVDPARAGYMLYRLWVEFAMGNSDRRLLGSDEAAAARVVRSIEGFVGWTGLPGGFIALAESAGFLKRDSSGVGHVLICVGFKEANAGKGRSVQSAGGRATALKRYLAASEEGARETLELWQRTRGGAIAALPADAVQGATRLMLMVCRVLSMKNPGDAALVDGTIHAAVRIVQDHPPSVNDAVISWLYQNRNHESIPDRLPAVFGKWAEFAAAGEG